MAIETLLTVNQFELLIHLGWSEKERVKKQLVYLDMQIQFAKPPKACMTDHLDDTHCYFELTKLIEKQIIPKSFHLIEHLTHDIYHLAKKYLPKKTKLKVHITKYPAIKNLSGGVCFSYGDALA